MSRVQVTTAGLWPHDVIVEGPYYIGQTVGLVVGRESTRPSVLIGSGLNAERADIVWTVDRMEGPCDCNACFAMGVRGSDSDEEEDNRGRL